MGQTGVVTNAMINASAEALVELINENDLSRRATFPEIKDIRSIAAHLAMRVMMQAIDEGVKVKFMLSPPWEVILFPWATPSGIISM